MHAACLRELHGAPAAGGAEACFHCAHFRMVLRGLGRAEADAWWRALGPAGGVACGALQVGERGG